MLIGYARVSTTDPTLALPEDPLRAGCTTIFTNHASGARQDRPGLPAAERGDVLVARRLDRLGRSLSHLLAVSMRPCGNGDCPPSRHLVSNPVACGIGGRP